MSLRLPVPRDYPDRPSLQHSVRDGCAHAVMMGAGEAYLSAYGIFLGMGATALGFLSSLPLFVGSLAQLGTVWLLDRVRSRKPVALAAAAVQAAAWIFIIAAPRALPDRAQALLIATALIYYAAGNVIAPAWNSWVGDLVPPAIRGDYFGLRSQLCTAFQLLGLVGAGGALYWGGARLGQWAAYAAIFTLAALARLVSAGYLYRQREPEYQAPDRGARFSLLEFLRRAPLTDFGRFCFYVTLTLAATHLSGPFFALYMLRDLHFSYLEFMAASATVLLAQAVTLRYWGVLGDRFGNRAILMLTGALMPITPLLWCFTDRFEAILAFQLFGGAVWAGYNLAAMNFLFDAVSPVKRARCSAYFSVLANAGVLTGALLGGYLAPLLPRTLAIGPWEWRTISSLQVLFLISAAARLTITAIFLPLVREVRAHESFGQVFFRVAHLSARGMHLGILGGQHPSERKGS